MLVFEVHQPHRLRRSLFWENKMFRRQEKDALFNYYFDNEVDREIFNRAARKCYFPSNEILLNSIDEHKRDPKQVKISFSISGVFLEQCEMFNPDLLETFKQLRATGHVEFLNQTYYHSVSSLYPDKEEFIEQAKMHKQIIKDLLGYTPTIFENTELLYNNVIAKTVEEMGFHGIYTEGAEKILGEKSSNYLYTPPEGKIRILLRNYKLTDDVGFRFSSRWWPEWPLTADKYAGWLANTPGECITIFPDYETFGEHHWAETGILSFLQHLPDEILKIENLNMKTPSEAVESHHPVGEIDVPEGKSTVSWADVQRDQSGWLGNVMQWAYYTVLRRLEPLVHEADDSEFLKLWRDFQISDHLYYMFTAGGAPGEVHSYFSPYESPMDAFVVAQALVNDFETRLRLAVFAANEPFLFYTGSGKQYYTGTMAWSLKGFIQALSKVEVKSIDFHLQNGDFESWAKFCLQDPKLASDLKTLKESTEQGEKLRRTILNLTKKRYFTLTKEIQDASKLL